MSYKNVTCVIGRVRIAHVPYAKSLALEKKKVTEAVVKSADNKIETKTVAQTTKRTRVAHIPQTVNFDIAKILYPFQIDLTKHMNFFIICNTK